jgi:HEPN domain-containing protein
MQSQEQLTAVLDFATRSFRNEADRDYLAARMLHRAELDRQFLWAALQTVEKYLKAILLFNLQSSRGLSHNVTSALSRVTQLPFGPKLPKDVVEFIAYLNEEGPNRYFDFPMELRSDALHALDRTVWYVRRYCQSFPDPPQGWTKSDADWSARYVRYLESYAADDKPHKFRLLGGVLEEVLSGRSPVRDALVWKNFYYGRRKKHKIRYKWRSSSDIPTHYMHVEWYKHLENLVDFPKPVRNQF